MKFLLDENTSKSTAQFLTQLGHTVFRIKLINPGIEDFQVLKLTTEKEAILITLDKDYGELIFKHGKSHKGVIFLRLENQTSENTIKVLAWLLSTYPVEKFQHNFVTVTENGKFKARFKDK